MTLRDYFSKNWYFLNKMLENSEVDISAKYDILQIKSALQVIFDLETAALSI